MTGDRRIERVGPDYLVAGRYRIRSKIGGGAMGAVWLAQDELLNRQVAIKQVISPSGLTPEAAEELRQRSLREGRIAAKLTHRNAISMHDVALEQDEPWLVMEYLPSRSLAQVLQIGGTMPPNQVAQAGAQVADAMAEAHALGIIHRDIKPANILIANTDRANGLVKITDFGISTVKDDIQLTKTGVITGTPAYFAPEVARGENPNEASDVYSLGATLYTATEGTPPYGTDDNAIALLHKVAAGHIRRPTRSGPLTDALYHMLEPEPSRRPTMKQARDELLRIAARGSTNNARTILEKPLRAPTGETPAWQQTGRPRTSYNGSRAARYPHTAAQADTRTSHAGAQPNVNPLNSGYRTALSSDSSAHGNAPASTESAAWTVAIAMMILALICVIITAIIVF